jgi:lipid A ethanolaminephosphotransferase
MHRAMALRRKFRIQISYGWFAVLFPILLYAICNALNIGKLARWFYGKEGLDYLGLAAYLVTGLCLFIAFFALFAHRRTTKPLAILLVGVSGAVTYFIAKYDVAIDSSMVRNAIHTDATEVGQLLSTQMIPYVVGLILVPTILISFIEVTFEHTGRHLLGSLKLVSLALLAAITLFYFNYAAILRAGNISNKYIVYSLVPVNAISAAASVIHKSVKPLLPSAQASVRISGRVASPDNLVVVLAIGESSRRKNFSLYGYDRRNTTPTLLNTEGLQRLNGVARIGSTLYALPEILAKQGVALTTLVSRLGIPTSCYVNYTLYDNCASVGETAVKNCGHGGKCYDEDVVPLLNDALANYVSGYRLIVLHLGGGSHGPRYADRYPAEFQKFRPMCTDADVVNRCTPEEVYAAYDNSILYVDHVLGQVIQGLDASHVPYVFIYLSDHGESLMEDGRLFHGMPPGVRLPPEQAEIPLIVKSSVPISIVRRAEYPQQDVFDTVLDLLSIQTPLFNTSGSFIKKASKDERVAAAKDRAVRCRVQRGTRRQPRCD